ncbi:MAG: 16S rRNA (cytidine(1402)-2'-O)-methyltransferase [Opitutales bacterium]|nr:16S rRNA (cytidine(1402)-2'-O)-methyltransferase [Opitutales bacterium]
MESDLATGEERLEAALYVVATPIGNRAELSPRARRILYAADLIACEDTRHTRRLFGEESPGGQLVACHEHNESEIAPRLAKAVREGSVVALVSDAGMPAVSDPGFRVVRHLRAEGLPVRVVSGPCAFVNALAGSGLPSDGFLFLGFLPPKRAARIRALELYREFDYTLIFYESTHRIEKFLAEIVETLGPERVISVARELTKRHEQQITGTAEAVAKTLAAGSRKGEFVVLIAKNGFSL